MRTIAIVGLLFLGGTGWAEDRFWDDTSRDADKALEERRFEDAIRMYEKLQTYVSLNRISDWRIVYVKSRLGSTNYLAGRCEIAEKLLLESLLAVEEFRRPSAVDLHNAATSAWFLGDLYLGKKQYASAYVNYKLAANYFKSCVSALPEAADRARGCKLRAADAVIASGGINMNAANYDDAIKLLERCAGTGVLFRQGHIHALAVEQLMAEKEIRLLAYPDLERRLLLALDLAGQERRLNPIAHDYVRRVYARMYARVCSYILENNRLPLNPPNGIFLRDLQVLKRLVDTAEKGNGEKQCVAIQTLGLIGKKAIVAVPILRALAKGGDAILRRYAAMALLGIGVDIRSATETLVSELSRGEGKEKDAVRASVVEAARLLESLQAGQDDAGKEELGAATKLLQDAAEPPKEANVEKPNPPLTEGGSNARSPFMAVVMKNGKRYIGRFLGLKDGAIQIRLQDGVTKSLRNEEVQESWTSEME